MIAEFQYEIAFALTIGIEYLVLLALVRNGPWRLLLYSVLVNGLTWPIANVVFRTTTVSYWLAETAVWLVEGVLLTFLLRTGVLHGLGLSLAANLVTALIGWYATGRLTG